MQIDDLLSAVETHVTSQEKLATLSIPKDWSQGRTCYGGLSAAMVYHAIRQSISPERVMRSFTCNFVGPLNVETPFRIETEILREGKNASQVIGKAIQDDGVSVMCQASFGISRESKIAVANTDTHEMALPKKAKFIPQIPKVTPKFLRHFDLAIEDGGLPFTGSKKHHIHGWMRYKDAPSTFTDSHLIGMIDAWPPTLLQMLRWPAPASSMSWNLEFIHPHKALLPTDWFAYQASTRQAADGYGHTEANIWDQHGELVAISRQTVAIFD